MTQKVTKRQQAVLDCIEACIREKGYGPTVREVCQSLGLSSPSTVHVHLKALEDKGFIKRDPLKSRSIALTYPIEEVPSPVTAFAAVYSKLVNVPLVAGPFWMTDSYSVIACSFASSNDGSHEGKAVQVVVTGA